METVYFSEYEKISQNFHKLDEKLLQQLNKLKWCVTEKVHGANFSFIFQDNRLMFAKRKALLAWGDDFFAFQLVVKQLEDKVLALFEALRLNIDAQAYMIYGELFGGQYPHPDVAALPHIQPVQTGVFYSPKILFCAFDIAIQPWSGDKYYLDYETSLAYFEAHELLHARVLFGGKLNDALNFNTQMNSTIPALLGLPALNDNLMEGVVVKPLKHLDVLPQGVRPVIKVKNKQFDEEGKFHQAEKWSYIPDVETKSEALGFIFEELLPFINQNRFHSAVSKTGAYHANDVARVEEIVQEFSTDVLTDFDGQHSGLLNGLNEEQMNWLKTRVKAAVHLFMKNLEH